ncbi:MAG: L-erythro-3,5-diaminohexanoate dehydrogenase [Actinomycetota bacterium]|nr:L-erythro-3,5-diaminohexanoate dehydrogenase [Actinomycetota bacterium]
MERYGVHRSVEPRGVLPQQARVLDTSLPLRRGEILIDVEYLNVDSASWHQMRTEAGGDAAAMAARIAGIVAAAGKMHNPATGSGGMLVGTVAALGPERAEPRAGTRIAALVSLTLTPLALDEIVSLDPASEKVAVRGRAILFESGIYAPVPPDLSDEVTLGVLDVCGAPAWMARLAKAGMRVVVVGAGGKSGMLACAQAARSVGPDGRVLGLCWPESTAVAAKEAGAEAVAVDCTVPLAVSQVVSGAFGGREADLVFVCANVPGCEGGAILACAGDGRIVFFSMATSFQAAALGAEGLGKSCEMIVGNGYLPGHAELALDLVRSDPALLERFSDRSPRRAAGDMT